MNFRLIRIFLIIPFIIAAVHATAQKGGISINGKITASEDKQPVAGASISIYRKGVGTATNSSGLFALIIPASNIQDTLKISCVGFKTRELPIAGLKDGAELNISLEKNSNELKEVSIEYHDALKIIQKAIIRIPQNYINHPHIIRGFYRMYTFNNNNPLQLSEAVFDVYNFGYADKRADLFRLIKARNEKNERDFTIMELGQKPNSVFEDDVVNHIYASGFLSDDGLQKHEFEVMGIVDFKGYEAYQINFKEKSVAEEGTFRGRIFIDTKTYAFIYLDYGLSPSSLKVFGFGKFAEHALIKNRGISLSLRKDRSEVSYQEVGHKWVLAEVKGDDVLSIGLPGATSDFIAHNRFNYQVTAVDTTEKKPFSSKLGRNENINNHYSTGDEKFWQDYNILLSDFNTEDVFNQIRTINKNVKTTK